jgi:signal transduction histidine kinase
LFAAGLIALAAANPDRRTDDVPGAWRAGAAAAGAVLVGVILTGALAGNRFPSPLNPHVSPAASHRPLLVGAHALLAAQAAHALLYAVAAVMFVLEAERTRDELTRWLAVGCVFGAFARINYLLFPSLYSQWLYVGDFLRSAFYVVLGYGAMRELRSYWQLHSEAAVFAERRRIARDLHDGTVQELGYIRTVVRGAKSPLDAATADRIAAAAERALAEARQAIAVLSLPLNEPMADVLRRTADEVADRYDVEVQVDAVDGSAIAREKRDAIVRVVREAVANAARHAQPSRIDVRVGPGSVEVQDDGRGFDPTAVSNGGYGLVSMRDRAEAVGAQFEIVSAAGAGTTVRMVWDVSLD